MKAARRPDTEPATTAPAATNMTFPKLGTPANPASENSYARLSQQNLGSAYYQSSKRSTVYASQPPQDTCGEYLDDESGAKGSPSLKPQNGKRSCSSRKAACEKPCKYVRSLDVNS